MAKEMEIGLIKFLNHMQESSSALNHDHDLTFFWFEQIWEYIHNKTIHLISS
jgi:hypothetical protein